MTGGEKGLRSPKNLNKTFARLAGAMIKDGTSEATLAAWLVGQRGDAVRFPDDREFREAIRSKSVYELIRRKDRLADLLWDLECASRTKYSVDTPRPADMSVEHALPQTWTTHWPLGDGRSAPTDKMTGADDAMLANIRIRDAAIQTPGNLTLATVPGNATASNKAFPGKKRWLKESLLALNLNILERETWDEAAIAERGSALADLAISVWPTPRLS